jgi:nucleoside-diphosphate-sugar epimerase
MIGVLLTVWLYGFVLNFTLREIEVTSLVFGATGMVGAYIATHLTQENAPIARVSRSRSGPGWVKADLARPDNMTLPAAEVIYCATNARTFAKAMPFILRSRPRRIVVISSTSVFTKATSKDIEERSSIVELIEAEQSIMDICHSTGIEWTILRPTLIYKEGQDQNITKIASIIRRLHLFPLYGSAGGLRQPIHAEDLALGAIAAARSDNAANRSYFTTGIETISYREMVGRVFDAMSMRRRLVSLPPIAWKAAFAAVRPFYPSVTTAMGERMVMDLAFDSSKAIADFGWSSRPFVPSFK